MSGMLRSLFRQSQFGAKPGFTRLDQSVYRLLPAGRLGHAPKRRQSPRAQWRMAPASQSRRGQTGGGVADADAGAGGTYGDGSARTARPAARGWHGAGGAEHDPRAVVRLARPSAPVTRR